MKEPFLAEIGAQFGEVEKMEIPFHPIIHAQLNIKGKLEYLVLQVWAGCKLEDITVMLQTILGVFVQ